MPMSPEKPSHPIVSGASTGLRTLGIVALSGLASVTGLMSCDDETTAGPAPTAAVDVEVQFPSNAAPSTVASLHLWLVAPDGESTATCATLIGATADPYDFDVQRRADVASQDTSAHLIADEVVPGPVLAYVEAIGFGGVAELAGCAEVEIVAPNTAVTVVLGKAKVSDCADPSTEDGAACDDGKLCTVGETCTAGTCGDSVARDCDHLADDCNAASCNETVGCIATPIADDTPCDDSLFCSSGDVCLAGECVGVPLDCDAGAALCEVSLGCDEVNDTCDYVNEPNGTPCDDGLFCTQNDVCSFGTCDGSNTPCPWPSCGVGFCDEAADACAVNTSSYPSGTPCTDGLFCTVADTCDGMGACVTTPNLCAATTCNPRICNEVTNVCQNNYAPSGTVCDDMNAATLTDLCNATGTCVGT